MDGCNIAFYYFQAHSVKHIYNTPTMSIQFLQTHPTPTVTHGHTLTTTEHQQQQQKQQQQQPPQFSRTKCGVRWLFTIICVMCQRIFRFALLIRQLLTNYQFPTKLPKFHIYSQKC